MSSTVAINERAAQRCAFCKIDLRGRFVFVNAEAEQLLGASQVDIFGHPLVEFLDPEDHRVVKEIISHSSHFETSYDSAAVTLVRHDGSRLPATVILSLNFRGGTPVNYEIIITPALPTGQPASVPDYEEIASSVDLLLDADPNQPSKEFALALCRFTGALTVRLFEVNRESGLILAEASRLSDDAVELSGETFTVEHALTTERPVSVQFIFAFDGTKESEEQIDRTTARAVRLISLARAPEQNQTPTMPSEAPSESSVDVFDLIGMGVFVMDRDGSIVSTNAAARRIFSAAPTKFEDILDALSTRNALVVLERLRVCQSCVDTGNVAMTCTEAVVLPDGENGRLTLCCDPAGQRRYLTISREKGTSSGDRWAPMVTYLADSLKAIEESAGAVDGFAQNLEHENHGELRGHGGFYLKSLRRQWNRVDESLRELHASLELAGKTETLEVTDSALILSRAFEDASAGRPEQSIALHLPDFPKLITDRAKLTPVMRSLMIHLVTAAESDIRVTSQEVGGALQIRFTADVTPKNRASIERVWMGSAAHAAGTLQIAGGRVLSLPAIRGLAALIGGDLQLKPSDPNTLVFELSFPFRADS